MKYPFIETIPDVLKLHRPSMYEGESFTALEYVSKIAVKINECIAEFNSFATDISNLCDEYKDNYYDKQELFQRTMEQRFTDFIEVIKLKYASQDALLDNAIASIIAGMPDHISEAINKMYNSGEFDAIVYDSIANLKRDFDSIVNNTTNFQGVINQTIANMMNEMSSFQGNMNISFEQLEEELRAEIDRIIEESGVADMAKAEYDTNGDGVVNDSDKLGGNLPSYYAKKQELDTTNSMVETVRTSLNTMNSQIATVQESVNTAVTKVERANNLVNDLGREVSLKLDKQSQAVDSLRLNGEPASFYAKATDSFSNYSHYRADGFHNISGTGDIIKFVATADFVKNDWFLVNGETTIPLLINGEKLPDKFFTAGNMVVCYLNGDVLNFNSGGAGINIEDITVYSGSDYPASPKENDIFYNISTDEYYMYKSGVWSIINYTKLMYTLIKNGISTAGELVAAYTLRQSSYTEDVGYSGFTFKSSTSNNGIKVMYIPYDIRDFSGISVAGNFIATTTTGNRARFSVFVGTESQIEAVRYDNEASYYGCTSIFEANNTLSGDINVENFDIGSVTQNATEPIYIGLRVNSYYGSKHELHLSEINLY